MSDEFAGNMTIMTITYQESIFACRFVLSSKVQKRSATTLFQCSLLVQPFVLQAKRYSVGIFPLTHRVESFVPLKMIKGGREPFHPRKCIPPM